MTLGNCKLVILFTVLAGCDPELENGDEPEGLRYEFVNEDSMAVASDLEVVYNVVETTEFRRLDERRHPRSAVGREPNIVIAYHSMHESIMHSRV